MLWFSHNENRSWEETMTNPLKRKTEMLAEVESYVSETGELPLERAPAPSRVVPFRAPKREAAAEEIDDMWDNVPV